MHPAACQCAILLDAMISKINKTDITVLTFVCYSVFLPHVSIPKDHQAVLVIRPSLSDCIVMWIHISNCINTECFKKSFTTSEEYTNIL
jgi:hypothetical protein